jgi:MiaB-like tRNA modifying enzyme
MKAYVESHGCPHNEADARNIRGLLLSKGVELTDDPAGADWIFLNTCGVKNATENAMVSRIESLKNRGRLVVTGCLPRINPRAAKRPGVAGIIDTNSIEKIPELLEKGGGEFYSDIHRSKLGLPSFEPGPVAIIGINEGCLSKCAFCGTKNSRGNLTSSPVRDIRHAVINAVRAGKREVWLTSEDTGVYGRDIKADAAGLLSDVASVDGDFRVRLGMGNPNGFKRIVPRLMKAFESEKVYKFFHVPVQSGSDAVLRAMRRGYTVGEFRRVVNPFREKFPDGAISTDVIVGFPTEADEDFAKTLELMREVRPDMTHVSKFYPRPGTEAARMKQLPSQAVKKRSVECARLARELALERNALMVGREVACTFLEPGRLGGVIGRAPNYKQVFCSGAAFGDKARVLVTGATPTHLQGELVEIISRGSPPASRTIPISLAL